MKYNRIIFLSVLFIFFKYSLEAQSISECNLEKDTLQNNIDSSGLKQGIWREFKIPFSIMTEYVGFKIPKDSSEYIYLTKDRDRKYFPIVESVGEYKDGLKTGIWFEYYGNGSIKSQTEYKNGVPYGKCEKFWGNGVLKMECSISYEDSITVKVYELDGALSFDNKVPKSQVIKAIYEE